MKMNNKMYELLNSANILVGDELSFETLEVPEFVVAKGSVLLRDEYERALHVDTKEFPDRTGYECFINHVHFPFSGTRESLLLCLRYAFAIRNRLDQVGGRRPFLVIVSVAESSCTVRFHEVRQGESWISPNLEAYAEEAILLICSEN
jgi:hypothetical protein